jgi:hypothetical protein
MNSAQKKALEDISAIRNTVDKVSGAEMFRDLMFSGGLMLIVFGMVITIATGATYWLLNISGLNNNQLIVNITWATITVIMGIYKTMLFFGKMRSHNLTFVAYFKKVFNRSVLDIDIPLELSTIILIIFFYRIGHIEYILPLVTLFIGVLFGSLGGVFSDKTLKLFGYIFIVVGAWGLFFMTQSLYLYTIVAYGVLFTIWGIALHIRSNSINLEILEDNSNGID